MARPKIIKDDESKDVHVLLGMTVWQRISKAAHDKKSSISALMREMAEEKYGQEG